mmetsp:Transcript_34408/g.75593  ORF Transcript_34408/g.75593 Transcript_34408/m.75593 type:complete len:128 (+) Transcript_34408:28-411(+)
MAREDLNKPWGPAKPRKFLGITYNSKIFVFWNVFFFVPPILMFAWNGFKTGISEEELMKSETVKQKLREDPQFFDKMKTNREKTVEMMMTPDTDLRTDWAKKRDEKRAQEAERKRQEAERKRQEAEE